MVLVITSTACGLFALVAALILQFRLTGWMFFSGLHDASPSKRANIDIHKLRRRLSIMMYFLASGFIASALFLYLKVIPEPLAIPLDIGLIIVVFNAVYFFYRKFDRNEYSGGAHRAIRFFLLAVNLFLLVLCFLFIR